ncbi:MAG: cytochrome D1 domain-containing protein [Clostridia bacterium]
MTRIPLLLLSLALFVLAGCAAQPLRGTGDLGVVIERASGSVLLVDTTRRAELQRIEGLGDVSHASVVFSRDARYAYVFGRDGGLTKVDLLRARIERRVIQSGNAIGGAISQDGRLLAAANYTPGGIRIFDADTLELLSDVRTEGKVVGISDAPGNRFVFSVFELGEIWVVDASEPRQAKVAQIARAGKQPYDGFLTPDGRYYIAGLYGEDGLALLDLWHPGNGARRVLQGYGRGEEPLPVFKMPHLRGWASAGRYIFLPAVGRHEVLVLDRANWGEAARIPVRGQPVFAVAQPGGRRVWVNFAVPDYDVVQVIDVDTMQVVKELRPGRAVLHIEFSPRGEQAWVSSRDDDAVVVYDTGSFAELARLPAKKPSGIFLSARAAMTGF